jgi:hypothetical protein
MPAKGQKRKADQISQDEVAFNGFTIVCPAKAKGTPKKSKSSPSLEEDDPGVEDLKVAYTITPEDKWTEMKTYKVMKCKR